MKCWAWVAWVFITTTAAAEEPAALKILASKCVECHQGAEKQGGLDLTLQKSAEAGGETGPALVAGKLDESLLWKRISADEMPPKHPLSAAEKKAIQQWIEQGAAWGAKRLDPLEFTTEHRAGYDWWALQPVQRPPVPQVPGSRGPVDAFIRHKLAEKALPSAAEADRRTLLRRLTFDLIGLPPTPLELAAFEKDQAPDAYEKQVDRLLASPHYGERWARHWLDVVRFGESQGFERDKLRPDAWRYRDWVIWAFNSDLPYDEFIRQQLAGDVLNADDPRGRIATGFLVAGPYDEVGQKQQSEAMKKVVRQDELEDLVSNISQTFLGLTIHCARCHDHKFDPISQADYYRLTASLAGVHHGAREPIPGGRAPPKLKALLALNELRQLDLKNAFEALAADAPERATLAAQLAQGELEKSLLSGGAAYMVEPSMPKMQYVLHRGNPAQPRDSARPGTPPSVKGPQVQTDLPHNATDELRRQRLAAWIADPQNPLTARVMVNRVWHYHFGVGLVDSPNDFGFNGGRPTHPELLDWLAAEFMAQGWSLKKLHRLLVTSATYRQSSQHVASAASIDGDNRLYWRGTPRRLAAEEVRDAMLLVSGELNAKLGGPGYRDFETMINNSQFYTPIDPTGPEAQRRSIYRTWVRSGTSPFLDVFDCPDPSAATPRRAMTTTPLQSLTLLNHSFVLRLSSSLSHRLLRDAGPDPSSQIRLAYLLCFNRPPTPSELQVSLPFATTHGMPALCRVLFNANEFLHLD